MLLLSAGLSRAQDSTYISLDELLDRVERDYPSILLYQSKIQALQTQVEGAKSWMAPSVSAGAMRFPYDLSSINEQNNPMNQAGIGIALEQMITNPRKLTTKQDYLNSLAAIEYSKAAWTRNSLRKDAKMLYYMRFIAERKQAVLSESEELLSLLLSNLEASFSNNQSDLQSIYKAKAKIAELSNMEFMLSGMISESNIGINTLLLRDLNTLFEIDTSIKSSYLTVEPVDSGAISERSDIRTMSNYIESMRLEQEIMKVGNKPDFGVRVEHMQMFGMPNQWSVMAKMTIPLAPWSAKMYNSESKALDYTIESMELEKQAMELMSARMLMEKRVRLTYGLGQYENYRKEIIPAYESNLEANVLAYKQNTGDFFVLLDAWEMVLMKKLEMYDVLFDVLKLEAEYEYEQEIR